MPARGQFSRAFQPTYARGPADSRHLAEDDMLDLVIGGLFPFSETAIRVSTEAGLTPITKLASVRKRRRSLLLGRRLIGLAVNVAAGAVLGRPVALDLCSVMLVERVLRIV